MYEPITVRGDAIEHLVYERDERGKKFARGDGVAMRLVSSPLVAPFPEGFDRYVTIGED